MQLAMTSDTIIQDTVTKILPYACQNCQKGDSLTLTYANLVDVGMHAFENCSTVSSFKMTSTQSKTIGEYAFAFNASGSKLATFEADNVSSIDSYAFKNTILKTIFNTKEHAFAGSLGDGAFFGCTQLGGTIFIDSETIGDSVFANASYVTPTRADQMSFTIQFDNLKSLGNYVFENSYLNKVIFSDNFEDYWVDDDGNIVSTISLSYQSGFKPSEIFSIHYKTNYGSDNFKGTKNLQYVENFSGLKDVDMNGKDVSKFTPYVDWTIWIFERTNVDYTTYNSLLKNDQVFYDSPLKRITFNNNAKLVGDHAFSQKTSLTSVEFGDSIASIGYMAFADAGLDTEAKYVDREYKSDVVWGKNIIYIGQYAFYNNKFVEINMESMEQLTEIDIGAFTHNSRLVAWYAPGSLQDVRRFVFFDSIQLQRIFIRQGMGLVMSALVIFAQEWQLKKCGNLTYRINPNDGGDVVQYYLFKIKYGKFGEYSLVTSAAAPIRLFINLSSIEGEDTDNGIAALMARRYFPSKFTTFIYMNGSYTDVADTILDNQYNRWEAVAITYTQTFSQHPDVEPRTYNTYLKYIGDLNELENASTKLWDANNSEWEEVQIR